MAGLGLHQPASARQPRSSKVPSRSTRATLPRLNFRSRTAGGHGHRHYIIPSTASQMVYDIPADPEWDLQALLGKVSDLCKEAVAGGIFLGDIGDLADQHDVTSAVAELQNQRFSVLRSLSRTLGATQEDRRADYGAEDCSIRQGSGRRRLPVRQALRQRQGGERQGQNAVGLSKINRSLH